MNDPRQVFKTLSELYQFNKKLVQAYPLTRAQPPRVAAPPSPAPLLARPRKRKP